MNTEGQVTSKMVNTFLTKQWIHHLNSAGFSFARIGSRTQLSGSAVQKLLRFPEREPHNSTAHQLGIFFLKVFSEPPRKSVELYARAHAIEIGFLVKLTKNYI